MTKEQIFKRVYIPFDATEEDCWEWTGAKTKNGQASLSFGERFRVNNASLYFFELYKGQAHDFICHTCDMPSCVNPNHLYCATQSTNIKDCVKRRRHFPTEHQRVLSQEQVDLIFKFRAEGFSYSDIRYKLKKVISAARIGQIVLGKTTYTKFPVTKKS